MGLDLGNKRIGVAISDELGLSAQGLPTIAKTSVDAVLAQLRKLVEEREVDRIVIGLPLNMNGSEGPRAEAARAFAARAERVLGRPCILWDERLTSKAAERVLIEADVSRKRRRDVVDQMAAQLILQGYLDAQAPKGESDP